MRGIAIATAVAAAACGGTSHPRRSFAPRPEDPVEAHLAHARALADEGYTRAAVGSLEAILAREPGRLDVLQMKASLHEALGEERAALAIHERVLAADPDDLRTVYRAGLARTRIGDSRGAIALLQRYAREIPGDADGHRALGAALYREAAARNPPDPTLLARAEAEFRAVCGLRIEDADAHHDLASVLAARDEAAAAEVEYRSALRWRAEHLGALEGLADLLAGQGRREEARPFVDRALEVERDPRRRGRLERLLRSGP